MTQTFGGFDDPPPHRTDRQKPESQNRQKTDPEPIASCEIDYFRSAALPLYSERLGGIRWRNNTSDGYERTAPVNAHAPNGYGLYQMAGNVWEWTSDWYEAGHSANPTKSCCIPENPRGAATERSYDPRRRIP
jgi:formylglycine-generating enzyme required for sulfatase activity